MDKQSVLKNIYFLVKMTTSKVLNLNLATFGKF